MMARTTEHHTTDTLRVLVHERELCPPIDESKKVSSFADWEHCHERVGDAIIGSILPGRSPGGGILQTCRDSGDTLRQNLSGTSNKN